MKIKRRFLTFVNYCLTSLLALLAVTSCRSRGITEKYAPPTTVQKDTVVVDMDTTDKKIREKDPRQISPIMCLYGVPPVEFHEEKNQRK